jgi:hypothetical protein
MTSRGRWSPEEIRALGTTTDVATAASVLGIGRSLAYELLRADQFPAPVIRLRTRIVVPVAALLTLLHLDDGRAAGLDPQRIPRVDRTGADYPPVTTAVYREE